MRQYHANVREFGYMPSRYMCDVLDDMRKMYKTRNFSGLLGSIEQLQVMAYRMEAALGDKRTLEEYTDDAAEVGRKIKDARRELRKLEKSLETLKAESKEEENKLKTLRHTYNKESKGGTLNIG